MTRDRLGEFLSIFEGLVNEEPSTNSALLLKEAWSSVTAPEVYREINRFFPTKRMKFDGTIDSDEFSWQLKTTIAQSFSVFLELSIPLPATILYELESLTQNRTIEVPSGDNQVAYLQVAQDVKVFSFVSRELIESDNSYSSFYALFGTILSV